MAITQHTIRAYKPSAGILVVDETTDMAYLIADAGSGESVTCKVIKGAVAKFPSTITSQFEEVAPVDVAGIVNNLTIVGTAEECAIAKYLVEQMEGILEILE